MEQSTASTSNIEILERFQSKALRMIVDAPQHVPNTVIRRDFQIPTVKEGLFPKATRGLEPISYRGALLSRLLHAISYRGSLLSTLLHATVYVYIQFAECTSTDLKKKVEDGNRSSFRNFVFS
jgi:predicted nuclease with RNAse H fold